MSRESFSREGKYRLIIPGREDFLGKRFSSVDNKWYDIAKHIVDNSRGQPSLMADGVRVLLYTWNRVFYWDGSTLDFHKLENCIGDHLLLLETFRRRYILSLSEQDEAQIRRLFEDFMDALVGVRETEGKRKIKKGPVGVTKTLHLLAPEFFPMWDTKIAIDYGCTTSSADVAKEYICFCKLIKEVAEKVKDYPEPQHKDRTLVKLIDEYNYATREAPKLIKKK